MSDELVTIRVSKSHLDSFRELLTYVSETLAAMYSEAEHGGDYSDADEYAADCREQIHRAADALVANIDENNREV